MAHQMMEHPEDCLRGDEDTDEAKHSADELVYHDFSLSRFRRRLAAAVVPALKGSQGP